MVVIHIACSDSKVSRVRLKLEDSPQQSQKTSAKTVPAPQPLVCPPAGVSSLQRAAPGTGSHKVFLHWNASKDLKDAENDTIAYCLYRSTKKKAAKDNPTCRDCEQINTSPIFGTSCVDDVVKNGATYYYVVAAISPNRPLSPSSNEIIVQIPPGEHTVGDSPQGAYPSCRVAPNQK
jgi:hypothetical protein